MMLMRLLRQILKSDRFAGGIEQAISSATAMVGLIVLSRLMSVEDFGVLSGAFGIWLIMEMVQHALTISPFVVSCPEPRRSPGAFGAWLIWNLGLAVLACIAFMLAGLLLAPLLPLLGASLSLAGPLTLTGMLYMFCRRVQYHLRQRWALLLQATLYSGSYFAALGLVVLSGHEVTPAVGGLVLGAASGVPALVFTALLLRHARPDRHAWSTIRSAGGLIVRLSAAGILWQLSYALALLSLTIWATPAAVAVYSVTRTLVRPVTLLISTVADVDFSRASRAFAQGGVAALRSVIAGSGRIMLVLTAPPIVVLLAFPEAFLQLLYGERYAGSTVELRLWTLLFIPLTYVAVLDIGLTVLRDINFLIRAHAMGLLTCAVLLLVSALLGQASASAALVCLVAARALSLPILHLRYRRLVSPLPHAPALTPEAGVHA